MYKICVFAGTTEGRELVTFLQNQPVHVTVCVATEYGETLLPPSENLTVSAKRLSTEEMIRLFQEEAFDLVIDATHPYADQVTESIAEACQAVGIESVRLLRDAGFPETRKGTAGIEEPESIVYVPDVKAAVDVLNRHSGTVLLTTGSKDLRAFQALRDFEERVYARVLPMESSFELCREVGLKPAHVIAMQGPFSTDMNEAQIRHVSASWLVTKDGGNAGGFPEKLAAVKHTGIRMIVIGRPAQRNGISLSQVQGLLCDRFGCRNIRTVQVVGIGPGSETHMTEEAQNAIRNADCLIGARRMLESAKALRRSNAACYEAIAPENIVHTITSHPEFSSVVLVMSGDTGFFSGTKKLIPMLQAHGEEVWAIPGISSLSYLCAKLHTSYEDIFVTSLHGREGNIVPHVQEHSRVFALVGGEHGIRNLCRDLVAAGLGNVTVSVGERLGYSDEMITVGTAKELLCSEFSSLSAALIEHRQANPVVTHGLPDEAFLRNPSEQPIVPMTKCEVRSVVLSKLSLTKQAVCWDIGSGTGSVALEMALQASGGHVYAIERREDAIHLIQENRDRFPVSNLTIIHGLAPDACRGIPAPSHVFIGGSSGNLNEILETVWTANPNARVVATAIALESMAQLTTWANEHPIYEIEMICMNISRGKSVGAYHLMTAQNPVYVFTIQKGTAKS